MSLLSSISLNPTTYRGPSGGNGFFLFGAGTNGQDVHFSYSSANDAVRAYHCCPPVTAIINRKAQAYINGRTWLLDGEGKVVTRKVGNLQTLLKRPNPLQSWKQFEAQGYIYQLLFGYNAVLPIRPVGLDNTTATALWNLPGNFLEIEERDSFPLTGTDLSLKDYIKRVTFAYGNDRTDLSLDDIHFFKDVTPSLYSLVLPESRLKSLQDPVSNIIGAYEARRVLINRRGALGILSNGGKDAMGMMPLDPQEKAAVQSELSRYGLKQSQWQVIVTSAALTWQQMGYPTKDLMLFEEIEDDIMRLCDAFAHPYQLMASAKGTTFANVNDAKKLAYQDGTIPEAEATYEQWNDFFSLEKYSLHLDKDFSHVAALQEDRGAQATARKTLNEALKMEYEQGLITLDQWLEKLGEDPLPNNLGQVRATDPKPSNVPLAVTIGVGGVQGLIEVITASGMSDTARQATLEILFGIAPKDAARMAVGSGQQDTSSNTTNQNTGGTNG